MILELQKYCPPNACRQTHIHFYFFIFFLPLPASTLRFSVLSSNLEFSISAITFFILVNCVIIVGYISISCLLHYKHVNVQSWVIPYAVIILPFQLFIFPGVNNCPLLHLLSFLAYNPSGSSWCTSAEHPVSCIEPGLAIHFTYDNLHVSMLFSHIIPPLPSPAESKILFYTSMSLLLSYIQGYCYHLSKFHIYALLYCWCFLFLAYFTLYTKLQFHLPH